MAAMCWFRAAFAALVLLALPIANALAVCPAVNVYPFVLGCSLPAASLNAAFAERLPLVGGTLTGPLSLNYGSPTFQMRDVSAAADQKYTELLQNGTGVLYGRFLNDVYSADSRWLEVHRNPGTYTVKHVLIPAPLVLTQQSPAAAAACTAGQIAVDTGFLYACASTGVWKRVAITGGY